MPLSMLVQRLAGVQVVVASRQLDIPGHTEAVTNPPPPPPTTFKLVNIPVFIEPLSARNSAPQCLLKSSHLSLRQEVDQLDVTKSLQGRSWSGAQVGLSTDIT